MTANVLATFVELMQTLSTRPDPKAPMPDAQALLYIFEDRRRPVVAALLTIAVCIREGRADV